MKCEEVNSAISEESQLHKGARRTPEKIGGGGKIQLKRSPTEGRGARELWEEGSWERSGRRANLRVSSALTPVTLSSLCW